MAAIFTRRWRRLNSFVSRGLSIGIGVSWLAIRGNTENTVLASLGLEKTGETEEVLENDWSTTRVRDWMVICSNSFGPRRFRDAVSKLSGEVVICDVEEHVMFSSVVDFKNCTVIWRIVHDAQQANDHLLVEGNPPKSLARIQCEQYTRVKDDRDVDFIFDIPIRVAHEVVGFRHDEKVERAFEVLRATSGNKPKWKFW